MDIIDSHNHFWEFDEVEHAWMEGEFVPLRKDFRPEQFEAHLKASGVSGTVVVQARESVEETRWLLKLADQNPFIKGVVGWIDLFKEDVLEDIETFASNTKLVGLRNVFQGKDPLLLLDDTFVRNMGFLEQYNLTYDLLITPEHLPNALKLVQKLPNQKFVIDHLAKPAIAKREMGKWADVMTKLAAHPNVYAKLSGMLTEGGTGATNSDLNHYFDFMYTIFGSERIMYGSDWPVCTLAGDYPLLLTQLLNWSSKLTIQEAKGLLGQNCCKFYSIA